MLMQARALVPVVGTYSEVVFQEWVRLIWKPEGQGDIVHTGSFEVPLFLG
jgi:hypothetical protein